MFDDIAASPGSHRLDSAARTACAVTATAPRHRIAEADEHVASPTHIAGNEHRLTCLAEKRGELFRAGTKGTRGPFAMNTKAARLAIDVVRFEFGDIMANIVDEMDFFWRNA